MLTIKGLHASIDGKEILKGIDLKVKPGEIHAIMGPNGSGKSTLLRILCGIENPDSGEVVSQKHARISYLAQADVFDDQATATDNLLKALHETHFTETERYTRVQTLLSLAGFRADTIPVGELSGGWRKRLSICRSLLVSPDVLVMDEPTNHLDIEGILWLEGLLNGMQGLGVSAFLLVSHDRQFLENCTNRVFELSAMYPDGIFRADGNYSRFLEERSAFVVLQSQEEERLANKVRRETEWLRRGPKARATKAKYRIDEAGRLQDELSQVRMRNRASSAVQIDFEATGRKTKKLLEGLDLTKSIAGKTLFSGLDIQLSPGSRR